jgi:hypothetical protein
MHFHIVYKILPKKTPANLRRMSGVTGAEAVPGMTSKGCRNFDWPICNACAPPHIIIKSKIDRHKCVCSWPDERRPHRSVSAPCGSLAEPLGEPVVAYSTLVTCASIFLTLLRYHKHAWYRRAPMRCSQVRTTRDCRLGRIKAPSITITAQASGPARPLPALSQRRCANSKTHRS